MEIALLNLVSLLRLFAWTNFALLRPTTEMAFRALWGITQLEACTTLRVIARAVSIELTFYMWNLPGFNVIYELIFLDSVVWIARIPLPYNCYQPEEISVSYAATLKYLKKNSTIPVPEVHAYEVKSAPENEVNATYILMERLDGHPLPTLERTAFEPDPEHVVLAKKVHSQLADIILQLGIFIDCLYLFLVHIHMLT